MASVCISRCVDDARVPVRATYVNLYKWPESDFEFVRSMSRSSKDGGAGAGDRIYGHPRVVDSFSCRQLYLRSYTFSREDDHAAAAAAASDHRKKPAVNCLGLPAKDGKRKQKKRKSRDDGDRDRKKRAASCSFLASVFRRLLACTTKIDVVN
ncbi:uncharacterized protein LOC127259809 [Andrographis paniculata]|uniref:uncharacterized protein LOC127259809 n=1 Tax=Andrographis paniculata TaxID=175694 RepID=UPI0021E9A7C7|nr:uncharacterized protein LOC127259809 [Andrographis paniculata]